MKYLLVYYTNIMATKSPSFEETINALEDIVSQLERGDLSLDAALKQFEKGVQLSSTCQKLLASAEQKVTLLSQQTPKADECIDAESN